MANFVTIHVDADEWTNYIYECPSAVNPHTVQIDEDFLNEYRKALDVVYRFQKFVAKEIKNNDSK